MFAYVRSCDALLKTITAQNMFAYKLVLNVTGDLGLLSGRDKSLTIVNSSFGFIVFLTTYITNYIVFT